MTRTTFPLTIACALFTLTACTTTGDVKPMEMTPSEHMEAARDNEKVANSLAATPKDDARGVRLWSLAQSYQEHAEAHRAAARQVSSLNTLEMCQSSPIEHLQTCPLQRYEVSSVVFTDTGVKVDYISDDYAELESHMRCHAAHVQSLEEEHASTCPLHGNVLVNAKPSLDKVQVTFESSDMTELRKLHTMYYQN